MRNEGGLDQVATMELVRTGYIVKVKSVGFANLQYGEWEKEDSEMTPSI